ncbi:MAG: SUMF1/EgtB/PvdO family nonheme iron enzyme [Pirellulales bacterium]
MSQPLPNGPDKQVPATLSFTPALADTGTHQQDTSAPDSGTAAPRAVAGQLFGDYELLEEIARGGMGVVYKARQRGLKRLVAIKTIQAGEFANADEILRFQVEAQSVARLTHPGIVPVYEVGVCRGLQFYSMQYLTGGSLADRLQLGPMPPREGAVLVRQVAQAMQAAHEQKIIHRDLKPGNILLDEQGVPRVTDFGLAKQLDSDDGLTHTGDVMGTPSYMAPEQAEGRLDQIGVGTDIYALGAILYHVLTGRPPFHGINKIETIRQLLEQDPVSPRQLNAAIPRDLETITLKCLRKEPGKRYATAGDLDADLGRWLDNEPIVARPVGRWEKAWLWCKRRPTVAAAIALTLLAIVGSGIAIGAIQDAAAERQSEIETTAASEQARTALDAHLTAPAARVPHTLAQLGGLEPHVVPLLEAELRNESATALQRLRAAYGLLHFGRPEQHVPLDAIPEAPSDECRNIVAALQEIAAAVLPEVLDRFKAASQPQVKVRYAVVALQLGEPQPARELLTLRENPLERTTFIHAFADWHGDLAVIAELLSIHDDSAFRSGLCAALGTIPFANIPQPEQEAAVASLQMLYTDAPDSGTHSAAGWALRQWLQEVPVADVTSTSSKIRQWHPSPEGFTMLEIPSGTFVMGNPQAKKGNINHPRQVNMARPFLLADREVTVRQFQRFMNDAEYPSVEKPDRWYGNRPGTNATEASLECAVTFMRWGDAVLYCNWLSAKEELPPAYIRAGKKWQDRFRNQEVDAWLCQPAQGGYRLPTEAEWEYACRAATSSNYCFGDDEELVTRYGWVLSNSKRLAVAGGQKPPNGWGLFDMHGNAGEFCGDVYYPGELPESIAHVFTSDNVLINLRGGAANYHAADACSWCRQSNAPYSVITYAGIRVARTYPALPVEADNPRVQAVQRKALAARHRRRGLVLSNAQNHEQAFEAFDEALSLEPGDPAAIDGRAGSLANLGRWGEALKDLEALCQLPEQFPQAPYWLAIASLAAKDVDRYQTACQKLDEGYASQEKNRSRVYLLVMLLHSRGAADQAVALQRAQALATNAKASWSFPLLAALYRGGQYQQVADTYAALPKSSQAWYWPSYFAAMAHAQLGQRKQALAAYARAEASRKGLTDPKASSAGDWVETAFAQILNREAIELLAPAPDATGKETP